MVNFTADAAFVYYIFPAKTDAVLREKIDGVQCIVRHLRFYPRVPTENIASIKLVKIYQRLGEGDRLLRNAAKFYTKLRGSTSNKHRSLNYTSIYYLLSG
jgi:hypothetical protein